MDKYHPLVCVSSYQTNSLIEITLLGDYRPSPFKLGDHTLMNTHSNQASTANVSTTNLSAPQALNSQDYEHVLTKLLNKNKKRPLTLSQTTWMSSRADVREQEEGLSVHERTRARSGLDREGKVGEGEMDREKVRFDIEAERELEADSDGEWEEGRRKSLFDPRR